MTDAKAVIERVRKAASRLMDMPEMQPDLEYAADLLEVCDLAENGLRLADLVDKLSRTACGTYNERRISVDREKARAAREAALELRKEDRGEQ